MSKRKKDPLLDALKEGKPYTWTVPDEGNLASMRKAIKHGQALTISPIGDPSEIQVAILFLSNGIKAIFFISLERFKGSSISL